MSASPRCTAHVLCALACAAALGARAAPPDPATAEPQAEQEQEPEQEEEDEGLRQRLTEREDKRRPLEPWSTQVAGRPLSVQGELEVGLGYLRRKLVGEPAPERDRLLLEQSLEVELFYSFGDELSLFAQAIVELEEDLLDDTFEEVSDFFVERGEMWAYSEGIAGSPFNVDVGRLDFEDERRWWYDTELDALRIGYELETFEVEVALARELAPSRSDRSFVEPEHERVIRVLGEVSWDWSDDHGLELFALRASDRSTTNRPGEVVHVDREDESDARLTWLGARALGVVDLGEPGILGYWLDAATVRGEERLVEFDEVSRSRRRAESVSRRDVGGWALDAGVSWILAHALEPRVFGGYAFGSGDSTPDGRNDRSFRQTELHGNEAGFGGVQRFAHYGIALDPELSNLSILTLGVGVSLLRSSSLDLVYHDYRLVERADSLRDARLEVALPGASRDLGWAVDAVLGLEEWERFELELRASAFRAGRAFGPERDTWSYATLIAARYAF